MASVNKVLLIGNLGRDPELKFMPNGDAVANLAIATSYRSKNKDTGEVKEYVEWTRVTLFGRLAEVAGQYLKKGSSAYIEGRLQTRKYTDKDGIERYATDVIAENLQMLDRAQGGNGPGFNEQSTPMRENTQRQQSAQRPPQNQQRGAQQGNREQNRNTHYNQGARHPSGDDFQDDYPQYQ